jgi:hypothetical protein
MLKQRLAHPLRRGLDVDDPLTTTRRQIIQDNRFLRQIYWEWYEVLAAAPPDVREPCWNWDRARASWPK